ncbi:MAG TPA: pectate lyase, partial [Planctomycetaceae bacterium]|nr:pectate lyase [Planctomycetaceae bacterium]
MRIDSRSILMLLLSICFDRSEISAQQPTEQEATAAIHKSVTFFRENCSAGGSGGGGGGYIFRLSADLSKREGEGKVGPTTAWIEPPATPAVGMAYLEAWQLCGDPLLKEAALETAEALLQGQMLSGGWTEQIEFDPADRVRYAYRVDLKDTPPGKRRNVTTFDDDKSQWCVRFLMQLDKELNFENEKIHEATMYALDAFVKAQYTIGAWPQRYTEFPEASESMVLKASYPETWSRTYPAEKYAEYYTLNDNTLSDLIETMLDAWDIYQEERFLKSAKSGGEFLLLAQLPDPQPGWAQQYNREMQPAWARKFEPPAITGGESQGVMRTLLLLYRRTGDKKFLEPIPRALAYYKKSVLPDGRMARFYELKTNQPLYFTKDYQLTDSDADMPTHYGFKTGNGFDRIEREYNELLKTPADKLWTPRQNNPPRYSDALAKQARQLIDALDSRGA